jgi:glycosyltransferase involved in cell wall biosynthesis
MNTGGISFIVKIRNEEAVLEQSIRSLSTIKVPHEIILILHRCTDRSRDISERLARENSHIRILTYEHAISRPGYENLATDSDSQHSLVRYYNWCLSQAQFPWKFKWDADFVATPPLVDFLNQHPWEECNMRLSIVAKNGSSENREYYFSCCIRGYHKHIMWEHPSYENEDAIISRHLDSSVYIDHVSELTELKSYWNEPPWFETEDSEEAKIVKERIQKLTDEFGPEPRGMARASNPECDPIFKAIMSSRNCKGPDYVKCFA